MSDAPEVIHARSGQTDKHARSWKREIVELAALFLAVGLAHLLATLLGHRDPGPVVLVGLGAAMIVGAAVHKRMGHKRMGHKRMGHKRMGHKRMGHKRMGRKRMGRKRMGRRPARKAGPLPVEGGAGSPMALWRIRMRVVERPGRLATVAGAFGRLGCNILALHIAPTGSSAITPAGCDALDEFVIEAPPGLALDVLATALTEAGGHDVVIVPAQVKDLSDPGVQAFVLAQRVSADPDRLPEAMAELLRVSQVEWRRPGDTVDEGAELNTTMVISVNPDRTLLIRRPELPFTPTEAARAAALTAAARQARYSSPA
ncbi:ACT domain-containing protein [Nonomuraea sp. M3C6]|uniref:ACT domain-containing protein n=1 Tax=Nonomuraea marmarensis TaxID=3351344 RepID=A0ABW7A780_9ACTN